MLHELYMQRCFDLARLGAGHVAPNPMVGAVLVHEGRIIGEGWHQQYGLAHAEVNAINNVDQEDRYLIPNSTLYVSLEPCNVYGKTPPCTDLILKNNIKKVVISCIDHTPEVKGKGVALLENSGVVVIHGILEAKGREVSALRNTFTIHDRPFIQLKFAQTQNGFMGKKGEQVWISNLFSKRLAHKMRSEYGAILIGTNTALTDNPLLSNRYWFGKSPLRIILDKSLKIPSSNQVFNKEAETWVITERPTLDHPDHVTYHRMNFDDCLPNRIVQLLAEHKITSLIVEGGAFTLNKFIKKNLWDEAWVFTGNKMIENGILAPLIYGEKIGEWQMADDLFSIYKRME